MGSVITTSALQTHAKLFVYIPPLVEKTIYQPIPSDDMSTVRKIWNATNDQRFRNILCEERELACKKAGTQVFTEACRPFKPEFLSASVWSDLCNYFVSENFQKKPKAGKQNRAAVSTVHVGGSINVAKHIERMELGRPANIAEVYKKTHVTKDGRYVTEKSKRVMEKYEAEMSKTVPATSLGMLSTEEVGEEGVEGVGTPETQGATSFSSTAWLSAVGGVKKGRILGLGGVTDPVDFMVANNIPCSSQATCRAQYGSSQEEVQRLTQELAETKEALEARLQQLEETREREQRDFQAMRDLMQTLSASLPSIGRVHSPPHNGGASGL